MSRQRTCWAVAISRFPDPPRVVAALKSEKLALRWIRDHEKPGEELMVGERTRAEAVAEIRRQVYERDGRTCVRCGRPVTWEQMHLHERKARGRGGEISVENSETSCAACHIGPQGAHGNRRPQFSRNKAASD